MPTASVGRRTVPTQGRRRAPVRRSRRVRGRPHCLNGDRRWTCLNLVRLLVVLLVPLLAFGWLRGEKTVTLQVDGRPQRVQTHARTVGELLDRAGVQVDPHDLLA